MKTALVLKTFPISYDGIKVVTAEKGTKIDVPPALWDGLVAEGYISEAIPVETTTEETNQDPEKTDPQVETTDNPAPAADAAAPKKGKKGKAAEAPAAEPAAPAPEQGSASEAGSN